jgi:hypothetical protein
MYICVTRRPNGTSGLAARTVAFYVACLGLVSSRLITYMTHGWTVCVRARANTALTVWLQCMQLMRLQSNVSIGVGGERAERETLQIDIGEG